MGFTSYIARRYLRSRGKSRLLSRVTIIAVVGIMLGVVVLDLTLAIMNGLHTELRRTFVDNMPMITVLTSRPEGFTDLKQILDGIDEVPGVTGSAPFIRQEVIASANAVTGPAQHRGAVVWGLDPDRQENVTPLRGLLFPLERSLLALAGEQETPGVVLGSELAASLYVGLADTLILTAPQGDLSLENVDAESRRFVVAGFLDSGMYDFDARFIYMSLDDARDFFRYPADGALAVGVRVEDMMTAPVVAEAIENTLGRYDYHCNDWIDLNRNLFQWVKLEKVMMFLLLGLVIVVAAFNIIGILTMMVGERRREIGILLAMGARRRQIQGIFLLDGLAVGAMGTALGSLLGWLGFLYLDRVGIGLPGDVYFVDQVPVIAQPLDFVMVAGAAMFITLLATWLPSLEASRLRPMEIIRYT
jgi:lipoprotein-releasing system permease protein